MVLVYYQEQPSVSFLHFRILKNPKTRPKWLEPDRKVRYVEVLRTYHTEYMPEEYLEIIALLTREAKMARV